MIPNNRQMIMETDEVRTAVDESQTIGQLCHETIEEMMESQFDLKRFSVLYGGAIYNFDLICTGYKPPYQVQPYDPATGEARWFGQVPS
jgi:hypothetical protein